MLDQSEPWEGGSVHSPSVLRAGSSIYLYYAAAEGIGRAVSSDGVAFTKDTSPVLAPDPSVAWETTPPTQPSVAIFPDGSWHMFYAAGVSIGEATSSDGVTWTRADGDPIDPGDRSGPSGRAPFDAEHARARRSPPFDIGQVTDPCLLPRRYRRREDASAGPGALHRVRGPTGGRVPPERDRLRRALRRLGAAPGRNGSPVYAVGKHEAAPALFEWSEGALLYVHQDSSITPPYPAIAAAVAPVTLVLPYPSGYAGSP